MAGGYLHSHWHLYPEGVGARQQQVGVLLKELCLLTTTISALSIIAHSGRSYVFTQYVKLCTEVLMIVTGSLLSSDSTSVAHL